MGAGGNGWEAENFIFSLRVGCDRLVENGGL